MPLFDLILLLIIFGFIFFGFWFGVIHAFGALVGVVFGAYLAGQWYEGWAQALNVFFYGNINVARVVIFLVLFTLVNRVVGFVFYLLEKVFRIVSIIPFLKTINRLAGAALGFLEGAIVVGTVLYLSAKYPMPQFFSDGLAQSQFAGPLINTAKLVIPLLPKATQQLQAFIPWITF